MEKKSSQVFSNLIWRFMERIGAQLVSFVVTLVLARILNPDAYGTVALINVIIIILQVFVDSGLANALIQKKEVDEIDYSTVFYTNVIFCTILYIGLFLLAPYIAAYYLDDSLTILIRVVGITIVISGVKNVQQAYVSRNMLFKHFFYATLSGTILAGVIGVAMALNGLGVWALVAQQVINMTVDTMVLWLTVSWRPQKVFSLSRLKSLYSYGWKLLASALLDTVYQNLRQLIIGKMYSTSDLAFYNKGKQFPELVINNVNTSIDSVLLPAMSSEQDKRENVKAMTRRAMQVSTYVMAPLLMGLFCVSPSVIKLLLTEKWLPCVPYIRIFCVIYMFYPIHTANLNAIKAMGRSDIFLKLEIIKKILGCIILIVTMWYGPMIMALGLLFGSFCSQVINTWPNRELLCYSYREQMRDILPNLLQAFIMSVCVLSASNIAISEITKLLLQIGIGMVVYLGLSVFLKNSSLDYLYRLLKPFVYKG